MGQQLFTKVGQQMLAKIGQQMLTKLGQQMLMKIGQQLFHTIETDSRQAGANQQMFLTYTIAFCHAWPILLSALVLAVIPLLSPNSKQASPHWAAILPHMVHLWPAYSMLHGSSFFRHSAS